MKIKHTLSSQKDIKPTIANSEIEKYCQSGNEITLVYESKYGRFFVPYTKCRKGKTWYAKNQLPSHVKSPQVSKPVYLEIKEVIVQDELF